MVGNLTLDVQFSLISCLEVNSICYPLWNYLVMKIPDIRKTWATKISALDKSSHSGSAIKY